MLNRIRHPTISEIAVYVRDLESLGADVLESIRSLEPEEHVEAFYEEFEALASTTARDPRAVRCYNPTALRLRPWMNLGADGWLKDEIAYAVNDIERTSTDELDSKLDAATLLTTDPDDWPMRFEHVLANVLYFRTRDDLLDLLVERRQLSVAIGS